MEGCAPNPRYCACGARNPRNVNEARGKYDAGTRIIDMSDLDAPQQRATTIYLTNPAILGDLMYHASFSEGIEVYHHPLAVE